MLWSAACLENPPAALCGARVQTGRPGQGFGIELLMRSSRGRTGRNVRPRERGMDRAERSSCGAGGRASMPLMASGLP
jgi:hypothetical protein